MSCVGGRFGRSRKKLKLPEIIPIIERIKKYEQVVDKMALVEHMNEVNRVQRGTIFRAILIIYDLHYINCSRATRENIRMAIPSRSLVDA
jgi:hypothetical protein